MKKITFFLVFVLVTFSVLIAEEAVVMEGPMNWGIPNANRSNRSFGENVASFKRDPLVVRQRSIQQWEDGEKFYAVIKKGDIFDGSTFGGQKSGTVPVVWYGTVTVTFNDTVYAKYVKVLYDDSLQTVVDSLRTDQDISNIKLYRYYYCGDGYAGNTQCGNVVRKISLPDSLSQDELTSFYMEEQPKAEAVAIVEEEKPCEPDSVITDSLQIECPPCDCKSKWSFSTWISHSEDHSANPLPDSLNYGSYYLTNVQSNKSLFIWTLLANFTAKLSLGTWSLVGSFEGGYNDGPQDYWLHLFGVEKNWGRKFYLQIGPELRYREWSYWKKTVINQTSPSTAEVEYHQYYIPILETGFYGEINWFNNLGTNHFRATLSQCYRQPDQKVEIGTTEISSALKLELENLYLFASGMFKNMPQTKIDSFHVPLMDKRSGEFRFGYIPNQNWIIFFRYRDILVRSFDDDYNPSWSKYIRKDYGLGLICKPYKFLGLQNVEIEMILSDSHIWQKFSNSSTNTKKRLVECKVTVSYRWKQ